MRSMVYSAAVLGASGYAGGEAVRLLDEHPGFDVIYLGAHTQEGSPLSSVHPHLSRGDRRLGSNDPAAVPDVDVVFLGLPHGSSFAPALALAARGMRIVDLGSDFRMDTPERYEYAYGSAHPNPESLPDWVYGLPELLREQIVGAATVAAPGCYPTAALLALAPLVAAGAIDSDAIVVDALSGVSGAGRSLRDDLLFGSVDEGVRAYAVGKHRHRPEMEMGLELSTGVTARVTFTPHLVPMQRGILATCTAPATGGLTAGRLQEVMQGAYRHEPFVEFIDGPPQTRWVVGSNRVLLSAVLDEGTRMVIASSAIDNLVKGAAGQAVQAANLMMGLPETAGLPLSGWMP